ncbi:AraC family transcriptional regulator [Paenibacillus sp. ClWae2A]|uniref:helix-turn-helix transcriptional regulator n=1 Tax=Paenibacillus sp. ClWae2A TaxID=3057177 RepID=UPI0028F6A099|nr:AraC family transcriptional regulator [Paenibacillus sp. ClWae2A]MDT9722457.1 AraC family transcriptional regulator [Paenibacillus sp. ClWae2A]
MRIRSIKEKIILFPGESEKWFTIKNDYIYIKSSGRISIYFNRINFELPSEVSGIIQCCYGSFSIQNIDNRPVYLQGIQFSCAIKMNNNFFTTVFDQIPFELMLMSGQSTETNCKDILSTLENLKNSQVIKQVKIDRNKIDSRLIQINRYIRKNYYLQISLTDLADLIGVHPTYLSNTYSKVFKISPIYYINQLRMNMARELLAHPQLSVNKIATTVGYGSISQFSSIFKRFHSISPTQFREDVLNMIEPRL